MRISRKMMLQSMVGATAALAGAGRLAAKGDRLARAAGSRPIVLTWLESNEPASLASLEKHAPLISQLSPTWFSMREDLSIAGGIDPLVVQFAARHGLALHPLIRNDRFDAGVAHQILRTSQQRGIAAQRIADLVIGHGFTGINMDFEGTFGADKEQYADLIERLAARLHPAGKSVTVDVVPRLDPTAPHPVTSWSAPFDYARLGRACDAVVLMAYDYSVQHPGSISPLWWVRQVISYARTQIPAGKLVVGLPSYGRHWVQTHGTTSMSSLTELEAQQLLTWTGAPLSRPARDATPRFTWKVDDATHVVHFDDRTSLAAKLQVVDAEIGGIAFWRLGKEASYQWDALNDWVRRRALH